MPTKLVSRAAVLGLLGVLPAVALGGGYAVPNLSPADLAMAGSRTAAQDSAAAVFANPSALPRLQGLHLSVAAAMVDFASTWTDPTGTQAASTSSTNTNLAFPPAVYASYGFRLPSDMGAAVGAGVTIPFGGNVFWPETWPGRSDIISVDRRIYGTYLTAAVEPLPWLRVGGGLIWYRATEIFSQAVNFAGAEGTAQLATSGDAFSFDLSAEIQPIEPLRLAVDYKHQGVMTLKGSAHYTHVPPEVGLVDQNAQHGVTVPNTLDVGVSYRALPFLLVTGAFSWDRSIVFDRDLIVGSAGMSVVVPRKYHNGHTYRLGVEGGPIGDFKVRLGVHRGIAPTPTEWTNPSIPDADLWAASIGLAYAVLPTIEISASYMHAFFDEARTCQVTGGQCAPNNVFPSIYDTHANLASLGVSWRWAGSRR
jgi:long-chain fatty acid transport protein